MFPDLTIKLYVEKVMTWNYRVIAKTLKTFSGKKEIEYGIYEVYYDDHGKATSWSADPIPIHGETFEELKQVYKMYGLALTKPILMWDGESDNLNVT
jgi:hypothetical protein